MAGEWDHLHPEVHTHSGGGGGGPISHVDLTGVTADQHHPETHAARHKSGGDNLDDYYARLASANVHSSTVRVSGAWFQSDNNTYLGGTTFFGPGGGAGPWDVNLYRVSADLLGTADSFLVLGSYLQNNNAAYLGGTTYFGPAGGAGPWDVNLYRGGADTLKTDDAMSIGGALSLWGGDDKLYLRGTNNPYIGFWNAAGNRIGYLQYVSGGSIYIDNELGSSISFITGGTVRATLNTSQFQLPATGSGGGLLIGGDANLYRGAANQLNTDDALVVALNLIGSSNVYANYGNADQVRLGGAPGAGIIFGTAADTNLYRSAADVLKTDDSFIAAGYLQAIGAGYIGSTLYFGSGSGSHDVNLYRESANLLRTDDAMRIAGALYLNGPDDKLYLLGTDSPYISFFNAAGNRQGYFQFSGGNVWVHSELGTIIRLQIGATTRVAAHTTGADVTGALAVSTSIAAGASIQSSTEMISYGQQPAIVFLGDIDGAKWMAVLGNNDLSFYSDNADTYTNGGAATISYGGRTYRRKARIGPDGTIRAAAFTVV